jgi:hypothetical protein
LNQKRKVRVESGFSPGDADSVDPARKGAEALENFLEGDRSKPARMKDKGMVMAERAAEVAAGKEKD